MGKDPKYLEREFIKGILVATANDVEKKRIKPEKGLNTKLCKIISIVADEQDLPITKSWFNYGQYPFFYGLDIRPETLFFSILENLKANYENLSEEANEAFQKSCLFFKKFNVVDKIITKNFYEFLESYYNNKKFDDFVYIKLYRTFFHLNNFINNEFYFNINKQILPKKLDYTKYLVEDVDISEENAIFEKYDSKRDKIRDIFNSFLFELQHLEHKFPADLKENVYILFDDFEKACLKIDSILEYKTLDTLQIKNFDKLRDSYLWHWSLLTTFISTQENQGLRKDILIKFYDRLLKSKLENEKEKRKEFIKLIKESNLELTKEEFCKVKSKDEKIFGMIHDFTKSIS